MSTHSFITFIQDILLVYIYNIIYIYIYIYIGILMLDQVCRMTPNIYVLFVKEDISLHPLGVNYHVRPPP